LSLMPHDEISRTDPVSCFVVVMFVTIPKALALNRGDDLRSVLTETGHSGSEKDLFIAVLIGAK
jgi:hypothetical protein